MKPGDIVKIHTSWSAGGQTGETQWVTRYGLYIERCPDIPHYRASRHLVLVEGVKIIVDTAGSWIEVANEER